MAKKAKKSAKKPAKKAAAKKAAPKKAAAKSAAPKVTKGIPAGYRTITPGCAVKNASSAIRFYQALFGAKIGTKMDGPGGTIAHAELDVGDSRFSIADPMPGMTEPFAMNNLLYTPHVDKLFNQATASGCSVLQPIEDQFWGDRTGRVKDPYGNVWYIATQKEKVSEAEMGRRYGLVMKGQPWR